VVEPDMDKDHESKDDLDDDNLDQEYEYMLYLIQYIVDGYPVSIIRHLEEYT
jgi:hypothetical protein